MTQDFAYLHTLADKAATGFASVASAVQPKLLANERCHSVMLWRQSQVQIELVSLAPGAVLLAQSHECDEVIRFLGGELSLTVDQRDGATQTFKLDSETEAHRSRHIEIKAGHELVGIAGARGAIYLSVQNYPKPIPAEFLSILEAAPWA